MQRAADAQKRRQSARVHNAIILWPQTTAAMDVMNQEREAQHAQTVKRSNLLGSLRLTEVVCTAAEMTVCLDLHSVM